MNTTQAHAAAYTRESVTDREAHALRAFADGLASANRWRRRSWSSGMNAEADRFWADLKATDARHLATSVLMRLPSPTGHRCTVTVRRPEAGGTGVTVVTG